MLAKRETQRYAVAWWNRYFRDLAEFEPKRIRARRNMADAEAKLQDVRSRLAELQSVDRNAFRMGVGEGLRWVRRVSRGFWRRFG